METPKRLILTLRQHAGAPAIPVVSVGEHVDAYQLIARSNGRFSMPIHTCSGDTAITGQNISIKVDADKKGAHHL